MESGSGASVKWLLIGAVSFLFLHRAVLAVVRDFDPDELQHMHGAYAMASGLVPHVAYFEHHTPWFGGAASHLVSALGPNWNTLIVARLLMWVLSTATTLGVGVLVHRASGRYLSVARASTAAWVAMLFHLTIITCTDKAIEIRPDVPATLAFVAALILLLDVLRGKSGERRRGRYRAALGGVLLGCALMLTPKLAFAALGIGVGALWAVRSAPVPAAALRGLVVFVASSTVPLVGTVLWLALAGQLEGFVREVVLGPLDWPREIGADVHLRLAFESSPLHLIVGGLGLMMLFGAGFASPAGQRPDPAFRVLPVVAAAILVGWFLVPVPWPQFLLPLWPLVAAAGTAYVFRMDDPRVRWWLMLPIVFEGIAVALLLGEPLAWWTRTLEPAVWLVGAASAGIVAMGMKGAPRVAVLACAIGGLALGALRVQPHVLTYGVLWCLLAAACVLAPRRWRSAQLVVTAIVAVSLVPLGRLIERRPVDGFRAEFDQIMASTTSTETVLTGWRGCAVFRPHAYRYFFLHAGVLAKLSEEERGADVLRLLEESPPAAVIRDAGTRGLSESVQAVIDRDYEPTGVGDIWLRRRR